MKDESDMTAKWRTTQPQEREREREVQVPSSKLTSLWERNHLKCSWMNFLLKVVMFHKFHNHRAILDIAMIVYHRVHE